ncbi:MAG: hypothetical protein IPN95_25980 [Bacteroidetes bacterium]|nr:hypothetical protein [Bacteroidota bacterium]
MARKDDIFRNFMQHEIFQSKWDLQSHQLPKTINEGLVSEIPIISTIALIVDSLESSTPATEKLLYSQITNYLTGKI